VRLNVYFILVSESSPYILRYRSIYSQVRGGARGVPGGATAAPKFCLAPQCPPQNFSGLFMKVLHRPLTAPLVAKLAPPVAPHMKMSGSATEPGKYCRQLLQRFVEILFTNRWTRSFLKLPIPTLSLHNSAALSSAKASQRFTWKSNFLTYTLASLNYTLPVSEYVTTNVKA